MVAEDELDGAELIRRFRGGDERAFQILFNRYGRLLSQRIRDHLPDRLRRRVAVSDVLQESLLVAYKRREDFEDRGEEAFRHWLLSIVELKARESVRRHDGTQKRSARREVTRSGRGSTTQFGARQASPSQVAVGVELDDLAKRALAALPTDYREVLRFTRERRLSLAETAVCMGRSREATKKLYARALARFREAFEGLQRTDG